MSAMEKKEGKKKNIFSPIVKYFKEVKSELKKVVFPTAKQTRINTTVVIIVVIIVGIIIGVLDFAFNAARNAIIAEPEQTQTEQPAEQPTQEETALSVEQAQAMLDELDGYTYDEEGNAVDENGEIVVLDDGQNTPVELTAETVEQLRTVAQTVIDGAAAEQAPEGGNE